MHALHSYHKLTIVILIFRLKFQYKEFHLTIKSHKTDTDFRYFHPNNRRCYFEGEKQLKFFQSYTKALCEWECKTNLTLEKCGCVKFSMPRDNTTKICKTSQLECVMDVESPNCECFVPCNDVTYSYKVDFSTFNRKLYENVISDE